jgi:hypothetical protein
MGDVFLVASVDAVQPTAAEAVCGQDIDPSILRDKYSAYG